MTITIYLPNSIIEFNLHRNLALHYLNEAGCTTLQVGPILYTHINN